MTRRRAPSRSNGPSGGEEQAGAIVSRAPIPGVLITFKPEGMKQAISQLQDLVGAQTVAYAAEFSGHAVNAAQVQQANMVVYDTLGVAVMDMDPDQASSMAAFSAEGGPISAVEPEPIFFAFGDGVPPDFQAYLRGYKDAVDHLFEKAMAGAAITAQGLAVNQGFQDTAEVSWGLAATQVVNSRSTGRGVRVAVLDTGLDLDHPDFRGRHIVGHSFIPNGAVLDDNGHGTHCAGTACGPRSPSKGRRYGIASESEVFIGKVLSDQGSSLGRSTLAGMNWAVANKCHIVSMSLGGRVQTGQSHLIAFEEIAREALRRNTLIVAAAGNDSRRSQNRVCPVGSPANCPSIMAVAAVDKFLRTADFSNGSINSDGRVDISAPGVDVYSSSPEPAPTPQPPFFRQWSPQYDVISGTSQATPHVAGIAALLRQENPTLTANELWRLLTSRARTMPQPSGDVGAGLVQA